MKTKKKRINPEMSILIRFFSRGSAAGSQSDQTRFTSLSESVCPGRRPPKALHASGAGGFSLRAGHGGTRL